MKKNYFFLILLALFSFSKIFAAELSLVHESELGITTTKSAQSSAQDSELYVGKHKSVATFDLNLITVAGQYYYGKTGHELNARNWLFGIRYDRKINDRWNLFIAETLEGNRFMGFITRSNSDIGVKYYVLTQDDDKDLDYLFAEAGYRLSHDKKTDEAKALDDSNPTSSAARLYAEYSKVWSTSLSTKLSSEYVKTIGNDHKELINSEISALSKVSDLLTFKGSYLVKYDNTLKDKGFENSSDRILMVALIANY